MANILPQVWFEVLQERGFQELFQRKELVAKADFSPLKSFVTFASIWDLWSVLERETWQGTQVVFTELLCSDINIIVIMTFFHIESPVAPDYLYFE